MAATTVGNDLIDNDLPTAVRLLNSLTEQVASVTSHVRDLIKKVREKAYQTSKGLSFLDLRYHLLLFYLHDITHLISLKTGGESLKDNSAIHRLVTIRTVLEKMRPLDQKLKYQIDKLVRTAVTGSLAENDPLHFRPNPQNLVSKLSESENSDEDDNGGNSKGLKDPSASRKYVPPRIAPVHYDGDMTEADRQKEQIDKQKRAALRSSVIQELRQQYSDAPEEIRDRRDFQTERESREELNRKNYEESMMVRLGMTREQRLGKRGMVGMTSQLGNITRFSDISALTRGEAQDTDNPKPKKKKKIIKKGKKKIFRKHK
ncbi:neuroguidin-like [Sinocyclocheilus rhinocerous]|uniref:Neuroguidin-like n=1 Tax=Sinocyclocheilus rhinocerous TaxID=307959 RepID=A0A673GCD3_9TELE|nr:PREDICTED: neuroguidin-like [Sinocyclocheilus rhinocerous]